MEKKQTIWLMERSISALWPPPGDECERAARHQTEATLKIHVHHSSSLIEELSSLYVDEVRSLPSASDRDPSRSRGGVREPAVSSN